MAILKIEENGEGPAVWAYKTEEDLMPVCLLAKHDLTPYDPYGVLNKEASLQLWELIVTAVGEHR